jgi:serralysin
MPPLPARNFDFDLDPGVDTLVRDKPVDHFTGCVCAACCGGDKIEGGGGPTNADDTVPGSTATTAVAPVGGMIQGSIDTTGDSDWYRITLTAGQTYTFSTILGSLSDSILRLRDATGAVIAENDDATANSSVLFSEITYTAATSGTFYLDVTGFGGATGGFFLTSTAPVADSIAASSASTATLTLGAAPTNGTIDANGDHDWFAVQLVAGQTYLFTTASTGAANDVDTTLMLRSASGALLAYNDDSVGTYSRVRFTPTTTGTYYLDVGAWGNNASGGYRVQAQVAPPLEVFSNDQIATQLTQTYWGGTQRAWNVQAGGTLTVNITALTAAGQTLAREALALWSDATGIRFSEVASGGQITFDDNEDGAFASSSIQAGVIISSRINVSESWLANGSTIRSYAFQTYLHEIGHALGLGHGGPYNSTADYAQDASYANDSWATTVMSYFDQTENTYFAGLSFSRQFAVSPLVADIVATTRLYGTATGTRTGDTVYGVGNTSGRAVYDAAPTASPLTVTIVDHGGTDTLNFSIYSANQNINLNSETFSNVGGRTGNLSIARGTVIENAVGGSGNDTLTGNGVANRLTGGTGNDTINGGSNVDTAVVSGNRSAYTITQTSTGVFSLVGPDGTDVLTAVEFVQFADLLLRLIPGTGVSVNFNTSDPGVYQTAMNAIRDFDGNALGGNGSWLRIGAADVNGDGDIDQILVNRAIGRFATIGTAPDGLVYFADHGWAGETRVAGIYIDPLVASGQVVAGSANDSQRRFQNDLQIENINRVLGANDYDRDGIQEVFFALTDGTAYLRALMHADGNIRYANYQSQQQVIDYLTANGFGPSTWAGWFPGSAEAPKDEEEADWVSQVSDGADSGFPAFSDNPWDELIVDPSVGLAHGLDHFQPMLIDPHGVLRSEVFA